MIDFLVSRSRTFLAEMGRQFDPRHVPVVRLRGREAAAAASAVAAVPQRGAINSSEQMS